MSNALTLKSMTQAQKVAALLIALGPQTASEVLKNINDENEVERIALEIAAMQKLDQDLMTQVLDEFYTLFQVSEYLASGGVNYAKTLLETAYGASRADNILTRLVNSLTTQPFDFFNKAESHSIGSSFQNENPQMVALVLRI